MARCNGCGADLPDYYTSCPNCGAALNAGAAGAPIPQAQPMGGYVPPMAQQRQITSVLGWLGWSLLCSALPIIGAIIMLNVTKDPTAKNFAKLMLILNCIGIVIGLLFAAILVPAMIGYVEKSREYGGYYLAAILPLLR